MNKKIILIFCIIFFSISVLTIYEIYKAYSGVEHNCEDVREPSEKSEKDLQKLRLLQDTLDTKSQLAWSQLQGMSKDVFANVIGVSSRFVNIDMSEEQQPQNDIEDNATKIAVTPKMSGVSWICLPKEMHKKSSESTDKLYKCEGAVGVKDKSRLSSLSFQPQSIIAYHLDDLRDSFICGSDVHNNLFVIANSTDE